MRHLFIAVVAVLLLSTSAFGEIPQVMGYQGRVTDNSGNPVADGNYTMRFRIYDNSGGSGSPWWDSGSRTVAVSDGVFSVMLGESPQPALNLSFDQDYWLLVTFSGQDQTPLRRLGSVGYAYMASGLVPGTEVIGAVTDGAAIKAVNQATTGGSYGLTGRTYSTAGWAIHGWAVSTVGNTIGVAASAGSPDGVAVHGENTASTGTAYGGFFRTQSSGGQGLHADATATTGTTYAGFFWTGSTSGTGIYGHAAATAGTTYAVYGENWSSSGIAICGKALATSGVAVGGYFESASLVGSGVHAKATSTLGGGYGGLFEGTGTAVYAEAPWKGVEGVATDTIGQTFGGFFETHSSSGTSVYGLASATAGNAVAVHGLATATSGQMAGGVFQARSPSGVGVYGEVQPTPAADAVGVHGVCTPAEFYGIGVQGDGGYRGVYGRCALTTGSYTGYGVYGEASGGATNWGVYASGDMGCSGSKPAIVRTEEGPKAIYAQESPEIWFEDFGTGEVRGGRVDVPVEKDFLQTVTINDDHPMKVFVTPRARMGEWWVEYGADHFTFVAPDAPDGTTFDYRVVAKRRGYEEVRLPPVPSSYGDHFLYPDINDVPAAYRDVWLKSASVGERARFAPAGDT